jgi:hypothetical protein
MSPGEDVNTRLRNFSLGVLSFSPPIQAYPGERKRAEPDKRQACLKGDPMKKHLLRISMIAALVAGASQAENYYAEVPFNFQVGNKTAQAGQYVVDPSSNSAVITIRSSDNKEGFTMMTTIVNSLDYASAGKLVFHRYGDRYFLAEVWGRGSDAGRRLPKTSQERELMAQGKIHNTKTTIALR